LVVLFRWFPDGGVVHVSYCSKCGVCYVIVTCETCALEYDDVYRVTYCPHNEFACTENAAQYLREIGVDPGPIIVDQHEAAGWSERRINTTQNEKATIAQDDRSNLAEAQSSQAAARGE
jgi:hypothetical protein